jgi:hypothetical protein
MDHPAKNQHWSGHLLATAILALAIAMGWFAYAPGLSGTIHFDDPASLHGLAEIENSSDVLDFVVSGRAGPLGRPLSLATFVPHAYAWPNAPDVFLRANVLLHLLNGVLLVWAMYLLAAARGAETRHAAVIGTLTGLVWMVMPILASSSLFIVQRMTTLSAMFVLLGIVGYLYARRYLDERPWAALAGMAASAGLGSVLAVLAKENGALLPVSLLVIEATLLGRPGGVPRTTWRAFFSVVLMLPTLAMAAFVLTQVPYAEEVILRRDFSGLERLLTQSRILWEYLYLAYLPHVPSLGPFHDDYEVARSLADPKTLLAVGAWAITFVAAFALRKRAPLFTFAVAWYVGGHLLESTTIPLELYFEHRNYLPLAGPTFALVAGTHNLVARRRNIVAFALVIYASVLGGVLYSVSSLWGNPAIAAEMWYLYRPTSIRAGHFIAAQMERVGDAPVAHGIIRDVRSHNPQAHYLDMLLLTYACGIQPDSTGPDDFNALENKLPEADFNLGALEMIPRLAVFAKRGTCPGVPPDAVERVLKSLLANPRYQASDSAVANIELALAYLAVEKGQIPVARHHAVKALNLNPTPLSLSITVNIFRKAGKAEAVAALLGEAQTIEPRNPIRAIAWTREIRRILASLEPGPENVARDDGPRPAERSDI